MIVQVSVGLCSPNDHTPPTYEITPGFKPFTIILNCVGYYRRHQTYNNQRFWACLFFSEQESRESVTSFCPLLACRLSFSLETSTFDLLQDGRLGI